jgi:mitochondrial chaperone BCS1
LKWWAILFELLQSPFVASGITLLLTGSLLALCRKLPLHLWNWIVRRMTVVVDVSNDDPLFAWISLWLAEHPYSQRARILTATSERDDYGRVLSGPVQGVSDLPQVLLTPAPGNHLLWYKRRLVWLLRERKEAAPGKDDSLMSMWKREVFTLRVVGRSQETARRLLEDARAVALNRRKRKVEIFSASYETWQRIDERDPRPLASVFLPDGIADTIVSDIGSFCASQAWYAERGIPWRRGYLLYGIPGSGKTSLIMALAGHFRMNLHILNLGNHYLTDDTLMSLMSRVPARSLILLEDVDAAFNHRNKASDSKLTFSGLLNALDGAGAKDGSLVFMTTNHVEDLDPALTRPGRADFRLEFNHATAEQANRMFVAFFPEAEGADGFGDRVEALRMSMAQVQNHLIQHRDSCIRALNSLEKAA